MVGARTVRRQGMLAAFYGASAAAAVGLTRFDGGVAFLWASAAILIAALLRTPRRRWREPLLACGTASLLVTGTLGLGWAAALPFAIINLAEAVVAAWLFRRLADPREAMQSLGWFFRFAVVLGIVAPFAAAVLAGLLAAILGMDGWQTTLHVFTGHSLGNITFTPLALLVTGRRARRDLAAVLRCKSRELVFMLLLVLAVSVAVFAQRSLPLLFLPVLFIILAAFRTGREGAAISVVVLAIVGGTATLLGRGAINLFSADLGAKLQFFQFYLAATVLTVLPVSADLRQRGRILQKLRLSEERFRLLAQHSTDVLMHITVEGRMLYVSPSVLQIAGHQPASMLGRYSTDFVMPEHVKEIAAAHQRVLAARGAVVSFRFRCLTAWGEGRWFETHSRAMLDESDEIEGVLSIARDISKQVALEERLSTAALTDSLTGLPNRRAFRSLVESRQEAVVTGDCVAVLDIDHFKQINDRYGHGGGDEVLRAFAVVAKGALRQKDVVARLGGEEFAVLFPDTSRHQALQVCERLRRAVAAAELLRGHSELRVTVSGGVASLGPDGLDAALAVADAALYRAKSAGRDQLALAA